MRTFYEWLHDNHPVARAAVSVKQLHARGEIDKAAKLYQHFVRAYGLAGDLLNWFSQETGFPLPNHPG